MNLVVYDTSDTRSLSEMEFKSCTFFNYIFARFLTSLTNAIIMSDTMYANTMYAAYLMFQHHLPG